MEIIERYRGSLMGLAVGDALGMPLEFREPGTFVPLEGMIGGGAFNLAPGHWTDDTSMALCLAESLLKCRGFDAIDQLRRYLRWYQEGYLSSTGRCFDIGNTVQAALHRFQRTGEPYCGSSDPLSAGNGSIMRLAPVPLFYAKNPAEALEKSGESSRTTHAAITAVDACRYLGGLIVGAVIGFSKDELLSELFSPAEGAWESSPLHPAIAEVASGSFKRNDPPAIQGSGYVVRSLEAALWAFYRTESFRDGALAAVNLGDDADTTGAVYGQLAGAYYGLQGIPDEWRNKIFNRQLIEDYAAELYQLASALFLA